MAFLIISGGISSAATVAAGNFVDVDFRTPFIDGGLALNAGYIAKIGFMAPGTVLTPTSTYADILPSWTNAGDITFASGATAGYNGYFDGTVGFTDATGLAGKNVFVWVTNGSNFSTVLENTTTQFLADAAIPNANTITISSAKLAQYNIHLGTYDPAGNGGTGSFVVNNAAPIPEPSAALLGALGVLGLLRRRRN